MAFTNGQAIFATSSDHTESKSAANALIALGLTASAAELNTLDGVTASTAELNILDGVTATASELNALDGVSSYIRTLLDDANAAAARATLGIGAAVVLSDAATIATDASLGHRFRVTLGDNRTLGNPTNAYDGQQIVWELIQDGTGSRTITLDTKFAFGTDITGVTLTTTLNKRDFLTAIYNSTADKFYVVGFVTGY